VEGDAAHCGAQEFAQRLVRELVGIISRRFSKCGTLRCRRREHLVTATQHNALRNRRVTFATQVLPAILCASAIFYGGLIRIGQLPEVGFVASDKLLHAAAFGGLAVLLARAAHWLRARASIVKKLVLGGLGSSLLGLSLELCQAFVPYRSADPWDWVADSIGALLAVGFSFMVLHWVPRRVHG